MPRRTEPKGAHAALTAYYHEMEKEYSLASENVHLSRARVEVARRALNIYEEAVEQEAAHKRGPRNVHKLSNVG